MILKIDRVFSEKENVMRHTQFRTGFHTLSPSLPHIDDPSSLPLVAEPKKPPGKISYIPEKKISQETIAVMPAKLLPGKEDDTGFEIKPGSEDEAFVDQLVRGVINNQLIGKGYDAHSFKSGRPENWPLSP